MLVSGCWIKTKIQIRNKTPASSIQNPDEFILRYEGRNLVGLRQSITRRRRKDGKEARDGTTGRSSIYEVPDR
jgi:hypothetical protein